MKLQPKILLLLAPFILVPLLGQGWVAYVQLRTMAEQDRLRQSGTLLRQVELQLAAQVATARANATFISGLESVHRYLAAGEAGTGAGSLQAEVSALLRNYQQAYPSHYAIRVLGPDGLEWARAVSPRVPKAWAAIDHGAYVRAIATAGAELSAEVMRDPEAGEPMLMVSRRIPGPSASAEEASLGVPAGAGYVVITSSLDFLYEQARDSVVGAAGHLIFTDGNGTVQFARALHALGHSHDTRLSPAQFDRLVSGAKSGQFVRTAIGGRPYLVRGRWLFDDLYAFAAIPRHELVQHARSLGSVVAGFILVTIGVTGTLLYMALRTLILAPITTLRDAAREFGRGNLATTVDIRRGDELGELAASFREMGENLRRSGEQIRYLAYHDSLTGLPNRAMVTNYLARAIAQSRRAGRVLALLYLDVDDFKRVNDSLGHQAGDLLLREASARISGAVRDSDCVGRAEVDQPDGAIARIGGDEFMIVLPDIGDALRAAIVARRVIKTLSEPFTITGHEFYVSASVGIASFPRDGDSAEHLIKHADMAMYHAKAQGKNTYHYFTQSMNSAAAARHSLEGALRKALEREEFVLYYQPQVEIDTGAVVGVEALIRWEHPERGLVSPGTFIPLAEETGLILPIGEWVLGEACRQNLRWQAAGMHPIPVSVNISNRQFSRPEFDRTVERIVSGVGLDPRWLELELTETCIIEAEEQASRSLGAIKSMGVQISMDDFGTGYSSLAALRRLPIDQLKIDQSFVRDIATDPDDAVIVATIIGMARSLNLRVVAEGVENYDQLEYLRERGCDLIQGYVVSPPVGAEKLPDLIQARVLRIA